MLSLKGQIVTADAMNCQRMVAAQVTEQEGDYVLALKSNQGTLHDDVRTYLDDPAHAVHLTHARDIDGDHGRIETRNAFVCTKVDWLQDHQWPGLSAVGKVAREREINRVTTTETTLLPPQCTIIRRALRYGRPQPLGDREQPPLGVGRHDERGSKPRQARSFASEYRTAEAVALNACKLEGSKESIKGKLKQAGWNDAFLVKSLTKIA